MSGLGLGHAAETLIVDVEISGGRFKALNAEHNVIEYCKDLLAS